MSPTNDPLIPKHLEMSAEKQNATPFTIKASSTMLTDVKAKMPSFIGELEEVNEQLGKSSSYNAIMTAVATMKLQAFTKDSAKVSVKDIQMICNRNTKPVSTIISTLDSLLDALTELLMRSTVPSCSWQSVTRLVRTNPYGSVEKINVLTQYDQLNKLSLLSSASLMWVAHDAEILLKMDSVLSSPIWSFRNCCSTAALPTYVTRSLRTLTDWLSSMMVRTSCSYSSTISSRALSLTSKQLLLASRRFPLPSWNMMSRHSML